MQIGESIFTALRCLMSSNPNPYTHKIIPFDFSPWIKIQLQQNSLASIMSLADELLADLESDEEQEEVFDHDRLAGAESRIDADGDVEISDVPVTKAAATAAVEFDNLLEKGEDVGADELIARFDFKNIDDVKSVSTLMSRLNPILKVCLTLQTVDQRINELTFAEKIDKSSSEEPQVTDKIEQSEEYQLLVEANSYSVEIDSEILVVHKFVKEHYAERFPELESLVPAPVEYANAVIAIGNNVGDIASTNIKSFLSGATFMIITMSAYESNGKDLTPAKLEAVNKACELLLALDMGKARITEFVSSRLSVFAPNISAVVGPHTAAQLMGFCGGLLGLSKTPNSNIAALGSKQQVAIGFGRTCIRQQGFLYHSEVIQSVPPEYRQKAMRIVSGKLVLAARVDLVHASRDGSQGILWRNHISERIEKLLEPPENKGPKALPVPMDKPSKKRGGKRMRKFKEQFQQTDLQKAQNRMTFGSQAEQEIGSYGEESAGLSMAGQSSSSSGSVRAIKIDNKTRARMSKGMQARLSGLSSVIPGAGSKRFGGTSATGSAVAADLMNSGVASSLSFTPVQGIELIDPSRLAQKRKAEEEDRWFKSGTFTMINTKPKGGLQLGPGTNKSGGSGGNMLPPPPSVAGVKRSANLPSPNPKRPKN